MGYFIRGKIPAESVNPLNRMLVFFHAPVLRTALKWKKTTILFSLLVLLAGVYPLSKIGSEFMPPLDEGDILYMPITYPGISITKAKELLQQTDRILKTFPEVESCVRQSGAG